MNQLETIAAFKRNEVADRKELYPVKKLENSPLFDRKTISLTERILQKGSSGIIAEFKRKSPSKGMINSHSDVADVTRGYIRAGAAALSVLTDSHFFGGNNEDLSRAREVNDCPVLRKEFIVDQYQIIEAKSIGADAILLIAAILTPAETLNFATLARSLGMATILEIHGKEELEHLNDQISILGVNNRNLADFSVSLEISLTLAPFITNGITCISESGIRHPADVLILKQAGYKGFLIGEQFMSTQDPAVACETFIKQLNQPGT